MLQIHVGAAVQFVVPGVDSPMVDVSVTFAVLAAAYTHNTKIEAHVSM